MGRQHRIALAVWLGLAAGSCSSHDAERKAEVRRQLLRAENLAQKRDQTLAAQRLSDAEGNLLPSNEKVAGIALPRGFKPKFVLEREWTYDGELSFNRLEQYFLQRLNATIEHPAGMLTRFTQARPVGEPNAPPVLVEVSPVPGREDWSRIHIQQPAPAPAHPLSAAEIAADLDRTRRFAH
jgi:hypothetical protein